MYPTSLSLSFSINGSRFHQRWKKLYDSSDLQHSQALKAQIDYYPHQALFNRLAHSTFRSSLPYAKEKAYLNEKGWDKIDEHAHAFIKERLSLAAPKTTETNPDAWPSNLSSSARNGVLLQRVSRKMAPYSQRSATKFLSTRSNCFYFT